MKLFRLSLVVEFALVLHFLVNPVYAQKRIDLTLEKAVEIMMDNSYRIRQLEMGIERRRLSLKAQRAGLKSRVYMNLTTPDLSRLSDYKWNSSLQRNEIVRENTSLWQMDLAIKQPVILLGYPTNGNISINYKVYRYGQREEGETFTNFYNRMYLRFEQPLFQPNELKNDIEEAELDLESEELNYIRDQVETIEDVSDDYYELFDLAYQKIVLDHYLTTLGAIDSIAAQFARLDSSRSIEKKQVELALANVQDAVMKNQSRFRIKKARMLQRLRLNENDILDIQPNIAITPISVDQEDAVKKGYSLRPSLRLLDIRKRYAEINFEYTKASNAFRMDLEMTYGLEKDDERYQALFNQYDNSNSVTLNAYIPIWDWGRRKTRIEAAKITLDQIDLSIEERRKYIRTAIINAINNLNEYQERALNMQKSVTIAGEISLQSIHQYRNNEISLQDILQIAARQKETEDNFREAYLDYRNAILYLKLRTYYDYEKKMSLLDALRARQEREASGF